jgi:hypothetical protein
MTTTMTTTDLREQQANTACGQAYPTNSFPREVARPSGHVTPREVGAAAGGVPDWRAIGHVVID